MELGLRLLLAAALWGAIEAFDAAMTWSLPGWLSLLLALVLVFGGWLIIVDGDDW
jgi:hypothetical protein